MQVEFLGVPRDRAGCSHLDLHADTLGELLGALVSRIPSLGELITDGRLHPSVIANLNGGEFVRDPKTPLRTGDHVLILSADVGG